MSVTRYYQLSNGLLSKNIEQAKDFGVAVTFVLAYDFDALQIEFDKFRQLEQRATRALLEKHDALLSRLKALGVEP